VRIEGLWGEIEIMFEHVRPIRSPLAIASLEA
jgi:hypothetical protein